MSDDPYAKVQWDGHTLDRITAEALHAVEKILGYDLTVVQGSYNAGGVAASSGTHDGGGAVDLKPYDADRKVRALRKIGFAAWHRQAIPGVWGEHIHAILIGNQELSPAAAAQVEDYRKGLDGLAGHQPDPTWRPDPIPVFRWPTPPRTLFPVRHRIVTANLFVHNADPARGIRNIVRRVVKAFDWAPAVIAIQEGQRHLPELAEIRGYSRLVNLTDGEASREIPVLLRSKLKQLGVEYHHAADGIAGGADVLDHRRGIFVVKYAKRGRQCAVVNTHMGVFGEARTAGGHPGAAAKQHAGHAQLVVSIVQRLRRQGYVVHVTADANSRDDWPEALPAALKAIGMTVTRHGVDLIASDPNAVRPAVDVSIIPKALTGSDAHDGLAVRTTERKRS